MSVAPEPVLSEFRTGVTYDEYLTLRRGAEYAGRRMAFHNGALEIMSPEYRHEKGGRWLGAIVMAYCEAFHLSCEAAGHTTFRRGVSGEPKGAGSEADESFYVGPAADAILDQETLDLTADGPPSLWIEVDNAISSYAREPLYAELGIPEVWRYRVRDRSVVFRRLAAGAYFDAEASLALPGLTPALVAEALSGVTGRSLVAYARWLRESWFPAHREELRDAGAGR